MKIKFVEASIPTIVLSLAPGTIFTAEWAGKVWGPYIKSSEDNLDSNCRCFHLKTNSMNLVYSHHLVKEIFGSLSIEGTV